MTQINVKTPRADQFQGDHEHLMSTKENAKGTPGPVQFRWRSLLGVSVGLFLLFGILLNILPALLVPLLLHLNGPAGAGWWSAIRRMPH